VLLEETFREILNEPSGLFTQILKAPVNSYIRYTRSCTRALLLPITENILCSPNVKGLIQDTLSPNFLLGYDDLNFNFSFLNYFWWEGEI